MIVREASADYFRAMGIPVQSGRAFTSTESERRTLSGRDIVDELLTRQLFGEASAVGRRVWIAPYWLLRGALPSEEIIGVVGSTVSQDLRGGHRPTLYFPVGGATTANHEVRTSLPLDQVAATIRRVAREIDPLVPVGSITTTAAEIDRRQTDDVILTRLASAFALMALALAIAGAYAVTTCLVDERTGEFGIRMALGASPFTVGRQVLARTAALAICGLVGGVAIYAWVSLLLASRLFGVQALDPATIAGAAIVLLVSTLMAAWLPARRATRVDPAIARRG